MENLPPDLPANLPSAPVVDPWGNLRRFTPARIALGRSGGSLTSRALLDFRLSHARARDAVHHSFDGSLVAAQLTSQGIESLPVTTRATDRACHLLRPDLGRSLSDDSREVLRHLPPREGEPSIVFIISDGLSALAAHSHAAPVLWELIPRLRGLGWTIHPVVLAPFARVKLQDEIAPLLGATFACMLLGERPGLGVPDSLGAYFTRQPGSSKTDADRNCISNIRPEGFAPALAAEKLALLLSDSHRLGLSGVALKDTTPSAISLH